jgi:hypothetical protein
MPASKPQTHMSGLRYIIVISSTVVTLKKVLNTFRQSLETSGTK